MKFCPTYLDGIFLVPFKIFFYTYIVDTLSTYIYGLLLFRANENGGMLGKVAEEKRLLGKELFKRLTSGKIFYKPQGNYKPVGFN